MVREIQISRHYGRGGLLPKPNEELEKRLNYENKLINKAAYYLFWLAGNDVHVCTDKHRQ